ncbi:MAG: hypothetical protein ACKOZV_09505 [Bacteroidota bacterium]
MNTPRVSQEDLDVVRDENHRKEKEFKREIVTDCCRDTPECRWISSESTFCWSTSAAM